MGGINHFGVWDYVAVCVTMLFSLGIGVYYAYVQKQSPESLLTGGKKMSPIPIGASIMVTYLSAITVIGTPAEVFANGMQLYMMNFIEIIFAPLAGLIFVKFFYDMKLTSVYQYLERRFDSGLVRRLASLTFIFQVLLWSGIALYAPAIALESALGLPVWVSIAGVGLIGTIYTSIGGITAVVWTDCFQCLLIVVGMVSIFARGIIVAGGFGEAISIASERGRLKIFDFTFDPFMKYNFWNFILGWGFVVMTGFGTHQPAVQRFSSLPSSKDAIKALMYSIPFAVVIRSLVIFTGISVFSAYATCSPILLGKIKKADSIIPYFMVEELAFIPGLLGIFVSCIFSAVLSTISTTLNSLAAVTWEDFLSVIPVFKRMENNGKTNTVRFISFIYGGLAILVGFGAQNVPTIWQASLTSYGATSGALGGLFVCAMFIPFYNKWGAISGLLSSIGIMFYIGLKSILISMENPKIEHILGTDLSNCPEGTDFSNATFPTDTESTGDGGNEVWEWPLKIFRLSYVVFPFLGSLITLIVGVIVSLLTGGFCSRSKVPNHLLHYWIQRKEPNPQFKVTFLRSPQNERSKDEEMTTFPGCNYEKVRTKNDNETDLKYKL